MLSLIAGFFTIVSVFLAGKRTIWAWPIGFVAAVIWVTFALSINDLGILLTNLFFCALYVYNFITWKGFTMPSVFGKEARVRREMSRLRRNLRESEEREEAVRRLHESGFFDRFAMTLPASPGGCDIQEVEPSPYVEKQTLEECKTCGCLLSSERSTPVAVAVYDIAFQIAREGQNMPPYENLVHDIRYDFFCKRDRPPYDRVVYVPQVNGETVREFFQFTEKYPHRNDGQRPLYRQVTEEGEQYD